MGSPSLTFQQKRTLEKLKQCPEQFFVLFLLPSWLQLAKEEPLKKLTLPCHRSPRSKRKEVLTTTKIMTTPMTMAMTPMTMAMTPMTIMVERKEVLELQLAKEESWKKEVQEAP